MLRNETEYKEVVGRLAEEQKRLRIMRTGEDDDEVKEAILVESAED